MKTQRKPVAPTHLTPKDVATLLKVKIDTVLGWIHRGELPAANVAQKTGRRPRWRIAPAELDKFLTRRSAQSPAKPSRPAPPPDDEVEALASRYSF